MSPQELFLQIAAQSPDTQLGKMFGAQCLKTLNGKAAVMFWKDFLIVKLDDQQAPQALSIKGAQVFTPMEGRAMNGWYQIPFSAQQQWKALADMAIAAVKELPANKVKKKK